MFSANSAGYPLTLGSQNAGANDFFPKVGVRLLIIFLRVNYNMWRDFISLPTERQRGALLKL